MFYSVVIPAILTTRSPGTRRKGYSGQTGQTRQKEKAHAGMTTEQSGDSQALHAAQRASSADEARALSVLYEQFKRPIHSYIYRLLGNTEDADDVTQEVFVRACTAWGGLYERDNLSAWLYRIATNLCVDMLRRRKRISWRSLTPNSGQEDRFDGSSDDGSYLLPDSGGIPEVAEREHIRQALARIPEEYAVALALSAAQGIPYQEIATILNISPNAAATRISRAKRMFAEQYQRISKQGVEKQEHTL
ncbi:MAG TPA: RNA polymerase sigma factor [Ktedonobacteraceae bacterium]|nr:RNA polymerase sigma factor [Ktedonobacteraceae bacterium]